ncbi:MAG: hypothetical protein GQ476_07300 [Candidatus Aminicenantes bacterium]|nr:hypothetical protein [Candidatus Aminicenantes bacterium]
MDNPRRKQPFSRKDELKRKPDELLPKQQGKDLMSEDFLDKLVMETTDTVENTILRKSGSPPPLLA